jgi:hypothetical protein
MGGGCAGRLNRVRQCGFGDEDLGWACVITGHRRRLGGALHVRRLERSTTGMGTIVWVFGSKAQ